jgi:hypothetical protein
MDSVQFTVPISRARAENEEIVIDLEKLVTRYDFFLHTTLAAVNQTASWKDAPIASITEEDIVEYVRHELEATKRSIRPLFKGKFDEMRVREWIRIFEVRGIIVPA